MPCPKQKAPLHGDGETADDLRDSGVLIFDDIAGDGETRGVLGARQSVDKLVGLQVVKRDVVVGKGNEGVGFFDDSKLLDGAGGELVDFAEKVGRFRGGLGAWGVLSSAIAVGGLWLGLRRSLRG